MHPFRVGLIYSYIRPTQRSTFGKFCPAGDLPSSNNAKVIVPFSNVPCGVGTVSSNKQGTDEKISCTKPMCVLMFKNMKALEKHLDTGKCKMEITRPTQLSQVRDLWARRFTVDAGTAQAPVSILVNVGEQPEEQSQTLLSMGWAIPVRIMRRISAR